MGIWARKMLLALCFSPRAKKKISVGNGARKMMPHLWAPYSQEKKSVWETGYGKKTAKKKKKYCLKIGNDRVFLTVRTRNAGTGRRYRITLELIESVESHVIENRLKDWQTSYTDIAATDVWRRNAETNI